MNTPHVTPSDSAGGSLHRAILDTGRDEEVLSYRDDLSCGPIDPDTPSGSLAVTQPAQAASRVPQDGLKSLLGRERSFTANERDEMRRRWHQLRRENAAFRVVTATGLASAPIDHFDALLMERVMTEWRRINRVIADTIGYNSEPYLQSGDLMLRVRVAALIGEGKLLCDSDPWDMHSGRVRLAD
jgi:hypothetical protein